MNKKFAIVLSGGGSRGAYEVGVLKYLYTDFVRQTGIMPHFDIMCGTSVGAIHTAFLASFIKGIQTNIKILESIWHNLEGEKIFKITLKNIFELFLGKSSTRSIFKTDALNMLIKNGINWNSIRRNIVEGVIKAVCVFATQISTGKTIAFVDSLEVSEWKKDPFMTPVLCSIRPEYVLASAAIPLLFPPVEIDGKWYCDGGIRLNTPLSPAIRLGADKIFTVVIRYYEPSEVLEREELFPNPLYLIGKVMNALFLDRIAYDISRLEILNELLRSISNFISLDLINQKMKEFRGYDMKIVEPIFVRPSENITEIAVECAKRYTRVIKSRYKLFLRTILEFSQGAEADIVSYILFEPRYVEELINLGYSDAKNNADKIYRFFKDN